MNLTNFNTSISSLVAWVKAGLLKKADAATTTAALALKASTQQLTDGLATKADSNATLVALSGKADAAATTVALNTKATVQQLNDGLATKADITALNAAISSLNTTLRAYIDTSVASVNTGDYATLSAKVDSNYTTLKQEIDSDYAAFANHFYNHSNPHQVTSSQVGSYSTATSDNKENDIYIILNSLSNRLTAIGA